MSALLCAFLMVSGWWLHGVEVVPRWCFRWCFSGFLIEGVDGVC